MTIEQFVNERCNAFGVSVVYIAVMDIDAQYDLEIELDEGTIGATYRTDTNDLEKARKIADELQAELAKNGIVTCETREEWEEYLED